MFYWEVTDNYQSVKYKDYCSQPLNALAKHYSALTFSEISEFLKPKKNQSILISYDADEIWSMAFFCKIKAYPFSNKKVADALAKMLIYLVNNEIISL